MSQQTHKCSILYHKLWAQPYTQGWTVLRRCTWEQLQCACIQNTGIGRGRPIQVSQVSYMCVSGCGVSLRRANYSYYRHRHFFKLMECSFLWASSSIFAWALLQNGVHSRLQICNQERARMGPPILQISDKSIATTLIIQKQSFFGRKHSVLDPCWQFLALLYVAH